MAPDIDDTFCLSFAHVAIVGTVKVDFCMASKVLLMCSFAKATLLIVQ